MNKIFVDSNVWVYLFSEEDNDKCKIAEQFILENGEINTLVISYQVINEVSRVLVKKNFSEADIQNVIEMLTKVCIIQDYSKDIALMASRFRQSYSLAFWDSHIVASAVTAKCDLLASEDMQDGFVIDGMAFWNIFA